MMRCGAIALVILTIGGPAGLCAQPIITLQGSVRDEVRGLPKAQVTAIDSLTSERRSVATDQRGFFRIIDLSPGTYTVTARLIGHAPVTQIIELSVGQRAQLSFVLHPAAAVLPTLEVRDQQRAEIQRMTVVTPVTEYEIRNLPLNTRNVMELAAVTPGIRSFRPVSGRALPGSGPLRDERALNMYLDGVEMKNLNSGNVVGSPQTGSPLPAEALREFRVLLNTYDAEFTRGSAYIISAVTHRGTNERYRSAFGFFQNKNLVSVNDFQRRIPNFQRPDFTRSQAGINLRGPFVRDRLFYALSYELSDTKNVVAVVPGRPAFDPGFWDRYAGLFDAPNRNHTGVLRVTWSPDDRHLADAIWSVRYMTGESSFGGTVARESAVAQRYAVNTVKLRHRWLPASRLANELSLQLVTWSHADNPLVPGPELRYPTLTIGRGTGAFEIDETQLRVIERATYSAGSGPGSHLIKGGFEISRVTAEVYNPLARNGVFTFRSETALPHDAVISVGFNDPESDSDARASMVGAVAGAYINDEWQVSSRLVLNMGLRYDADLNTMNNDFTVPWASDTVIASKPELQRYLSDGNRKNDLDNFSPRFSFSWDATGRQRTYVRGGFGIMYDRTPNFVAFAERRTSAWRTYSFANPGTVDADELRDRVIAGGVTPVPPSITLIPDRMEAPQNRQWSIGVGSQLRRNLSLNIDYIDQDVRKVFAPVDANWLDRSQTPARRVLSPDYGSIVLWDDFSRARYRALLTSVSFIPDSTRRMTLAHTLASAKADWDVENIQVPVDAAKEFYVLQRTSGDERHRFVLSGVWRVRYGFGISAIATLASPRPYRTMIGIDANANSIIGDDWIDGKRYRVPSNAWQYWYRMVDLRVSKNLKVRKRARLTLTAEAFNLFNTTNYAGYFGVQKSSTGEPRPDFGAPSEIFATRQLQFGSSLQF